MLASPQFLFCTCQAGAERALKGEFARQWPAYRFAYSRPGFVTFKIPDDVLLSDDFDPRSVFARSHGFSLGKTTAADLDIRAEQAWELAGDRPYECLHVWQRDLRSAGEHGYDPEPTELASEAASALRRAASACQALSSTELSAAATQRGQLVLDCIVVEPGEWWIGFHRATSITSCWPGGLCPAKLPADAVSRAWLKMEEGLRWSGLPTQPGELCAEIGCAPGGASQALLARGLIVTGIDPADVDPRVVALPNFTHVRKRGADVRRREFRKTKWLFADMNVAPQYTLDTVEAIVTHSEVDVAGLLLTLKLIDWSLADQIPAYLDRVRSWGYARVHARQLHHNRQEICVSARRK